MIEEYTDGVYYDVEGDAFVVIEHHEEDGEVELIEHRTTRHLDRFNDERFRPGDFQEVRSGVLDDPAKLLRHYVERLRDGDLPEPSQIVDDHANLVYATRHCEITSVDEDQ